MSERARRYQRYAAECLRLAQQSDDAREKAVLLQMAETWRRLAEKGGAHDEEADL